MLSVLEETKRQRWKLLFCHKQSVILYNSALHQELRKMWILKIPSFGMVQTIRAYTASHTLIQVQVTPMLVCAVHFEVSRCHTGGESQESIVCRRGSMHESGSPWFWNPGQISLEVQNRGTSGSTKRTNIRQFFLKRIKCHSFRRPCLCDVALKYHT